MDPHAEAVTETIDKLAFENASGAYPFLDAVAVLHVELPASFVNGAHRVRIRPLSVGHRLFETSNVPIAKTVSKNALA